MAVVFSKRKDGVHYEIRTAGRSIRMYTDNILHTQYHPLHRITGGVWDLLALPALALDQPKRVLMLGVGGGAAIHLLRDWCPQVHITGIELNPMHLSLARRYFALKGPNIKLIKTDARHFVENYQGEPFDMVVEDLFGGDGEPDRSFNADKQWCNALGQITNDNGVLVINTLSRRQLQKTAFVSNAEVRKQWSSHLCLTLPCYANHVGAFFKQATTPNALRKAVRKDPLRLRQENAEQLRYRISTIKLANN